MFKSFLSRCGMLCKFASSSLLSFALDYCLFLLFSAPIGDWAWGLWVSNIAVRMVSACFNYTLNKCMVFHGGGRATQDLPQYTAGNGNPACQQHAALCPGAGHSGTRSQVDHRDDAVCGEFFGSDIGDLPGKKVEERGGCCPWPCIGNLPKLPQKEGGRSLCPCWRIFWQRPFWCLAITIFCMCHLSRAWEELLCHFRRCKIISSHPRINR